MEAGEDNQDKMAGDPCAWILELTFLVCFILFSFLPYFLPLLPTSLKTGVSCNSSVTFSL